MNSESVDMRMSNDKKTIPMHISEGNEAIIFSTIEGGASGKLPYYKGEYDITPRITEQKLETKNKSMKDDITILQIPCTSVVNPSGGQTVIIGLE